MATDEERLIVRLEATQARFEKQLAAASRSADRRARQIESRFMAMNKHIERGAANVGRQFVAAFAATASLRGAQQLIDASTRITNALKVSGLEGAKLESVYERLFSSAMKNAAPVESLVELYSRASLVQKELGVSTEELLGFTDKVALALRVSGKSAQESSGALLQLSQALGSGVVRAEEFNSILEGALPIAQAAAAGLEEAGGSVAKLRQLVVDGKVSSEAFFRAFEAGSVILQDKVAGATLTVDQGLTNVQNALVNAVRKFDDATGASKTMADSLTKAADAIRALGDLMEWIATTRFVKFIDGISKINGLLRNILPGLAALQLVDGGVIDGVTEKLKGLDNATPGGPVSTPKGDKPVKTTGTATGSKGGKKVSLKDYPVTGTKSTGSSKKTPAQQFEGDLDQIRERIALLNAETAAQAGVNPLVEDYGFAVTKAKTEQELLNEAKQAGLKVTPQLAATISQLATNYAQASVDAQKLAKNQDEVRQKAEDFAELSKDVVGGFITDLRNGASAAEALSNALQKVADKLLNEVLDAIFSVKNNSGGLFSGLFSLFGGSFGNTTAGAFFSNPASWSTGGFTGQGGKHQPAGIVHKGEYVLNQEATKRMGVAALDRINAGYADGGLVGRPRAAGSSMGRSQEAAFYEIHINGAKTDAEIRQMTEEAVSAAIRHNNARVVPGIIQQSATKGRVRG